MQIKKQKDAVCNLWWNEIATHHSEGGAQTMSEKVVQLDEEVIKRQIELARGSCRTTEKGKRMGTHSA